MKIGKKGITRDGLDYEFTLFFDLDIKQLAKASKDRTGKFMDKPEDIITLAIEKKYWNGAIQELPLIGKYQILPQQIR